jgi:hypothetical protein
MAEWNAAESGTNPSAQAVPMSREELVERYDRLNAQWTALEARMVDLRNELKEGRSECTRLKQQMRLILRQLPDFRDVTYFHFKFDRPEEPRRVQGRVVEAQTEVV